MLEADECFLRGDLLDDDADVDRGDDATTLAGEANPCSVAAIKSADVAKFSSDRSVIRK